MKKFLIAFSLLFIFTANAQIIDFIKDKVKEKATTVVGEKLIGSITTEAITTNFKDCNKADVKNTDFGKSEKYTNLCNAQFSPVSYTHLDVYKRQKYNFR